MSPNEASIKIGPIDLAKFFLGETPLIGARSENMLYFSPQRLKAVKSGGRKLSIKDDCWFEHFPVYAATCPAKMRSVDYLITGH